LGLATAALSEVVLIVLAARSAASSAGAAFHLNGHHALAIGVHIGEGVRVRLTSIQLLLGFSICFRFSFSLGLSLCLSLHSGSHAHDGLATAQRSISLDEGGESRLILCGVELSDGAIELREGRTARVAARAESGSAASGGTEGI